MTARRILCFSLFAALAGCTAIEELDSTAAEVIDGTPEAIGILRFLNGPRATFEVLDVDARLDARAARNIVAHRAGADGARGTTDDDLFDDLAELDAVAYVGPAALDRLVAYVASIGGIPSVEVEGVALTQDEVAAIVAVANGASESQLDIDAALDARAARNLVAARPLADIAAVSAVAYVGPSAIEKLRVYAPSWTPPAPPTPPEDCSLSVTGRADPQVDDFDTLLALATTGDWPYAEMVARQANMCLGLDDASARDALVEDLVFSAGLDWQYGSDVFPWVDNLYRGSTQYLRRMSDALMAIEEHVADGRWDPYATSEGAALWESRHALYDALTARATAEPHAFWEVRLFIDAEECSQDAIALVDAVDYRIWIIHRYPRC